MNKRVLKAEGVIGVELQLNTQEQIVLANLVAQMKKGKEDIANSMKGSSRDALLTTEEAVDIIAVLTNASAFIGKLAGDVLDTNTIENVLFGDAKPSEDEPE